MDYEIYRKVLSIEDYYVSWDTENYNRLNDEMKDHIYDKYVVKALVFQRDNFKCQNIDCKTPDSPLTLHHIKWQKNGGKHSVRNGVTLCGSCHRAYHRAKRSFTLADAEHLPAHLRGMSFHMDVSDEINWRVVQKEMRKFRKTIKDKRVYLKWEDIYFLLQWLEEPYTMYDD